jgi:hypothetical protein
MTASTTVARGEEQRLLIPFFIPAWLFLEGELCENDVNLCHHPEPPAVCLFCASPV